MKDSLIIIFIAAVIIGFVLDREQGSTTAPSSPAMSNTTSPSPTR